MVRGGLAPILGVMTAFHAPLIFAFGDSLTAGYGLARDQAFPAPLERRLRKAVDD